MARPRRFPVALCALTVSACNAVLGLDPTHRGSGDAAVDATVDAPAADGAPDATICTSVELAPLVADGMFVANDNQNHSTLSVINISSALPSTGIVRFKAPTLPPNATLQALTLTLPFVASAIDCGTALQCGSCAPLDHAGTVTVQYLRSDWDETTVSFSQRGVGKPWAAAGAGTIGTDRSPVLGGARPHAEDSTTVVELSGADLAEYPTWSASAEISFAITPGAGTALLVGTHEHATLSGSCPATATSTLTLTYCN